MVNPTELRVGDFVVVIDERPGPYAPSRTGDRPSFDGTPYEVKAINLPFICVATGLHRFAIDLRAFIVERPHPEYTKAMLNALPVFGEPRQLSSRAILLKRYNLEGKLVDSQ